MRGLTVFLVAAVVGVTVAQQIVPNGLKVNANAQRGSASGQASSSHQQSGQNIHVGGSSGVRSQTNSDGSSAVAAEASGDDSGDVQPANSTDTPQTDSTDTTSAATVQAASDDSTVGQTTAAVTSATQVSSASSNAGAGSSASQLVGGGPVQTGVVYANIPYPPVAGDAPAQVPGVWDALDALRGKPALQSDEIQAILATAQAGVDYPILAEIPDQTNFNCAKVKQAGFYADTDSRCQVFRRCDIDGVETSYLCPNQTVFNQIVLVCDWFFNVNCASSAQYYDYSNSRLYHANWVLLDTPADADQSNATKSATGNIRVVNGNAGRNQRTIDSAVPAQGY